MEKEFVICLAVLALWYLLFMTPFVLVSVSLLLSLLLLGMMPGIDWAIPAEIMFLIYTTAFTALVIFAKERGYYPGSPQLNAAQRKANARARRYYNRRLATLDRQARSYKRAATRAPRIKPSSLGSA